MTRNEFKELIKTKKLILDGATGSNLIKRGMPEGVCPEKWILDNPDVIKTLQKEYIMAGSDILYAPTFSGNRIKLEEYGLQDDLTKINEGLVKLSKEAVIEAGISKKVYVAGDITMTGKQLYPVGTLKFEELVDVYKEQIRCLDKAGADLIVVETMMSLQECRAAVIAVKECSELPVMVTLTFNEDGRTLFGSTPETCALVLSSMDVDAVGVNCSTGPDKMADVVKKMSAYTELPIIAKPNAGMPILVDSVTVYPLEPDDFANQMMAIVENGADILGGCCGSTPEHIKALCDKLAEEKLSDNIKFTERKGKVIRRALSTERNVLPIDLDGDFIIIGERINPTGKKKLQEELKNGSVELVGEMAESEVVNGANILDVNMGMNGIDEKEMMLKSVYELTMLTDSPLSIDSSYVDVIEAALRIYPGRALINSISLEEEKFEKLIPVARKYGAMFILLPLSGAGLPKDIEEKKSIINKIMERAAMFGLTNEDVVVDGLVATIGANKNAAKETLETIRYCKEELKTATCCGLSNISFGLPERMFVNSNFMSMAIMSGLTMAIANPSQELLMHAVYAADLLMNKPDSDIRYIDRVNNMKISVVTGEVSSDAVSSAQKSVSSKQSEVIPEEYQNDDLFEAVVKGKKNRTAELIKDMLDNGENAQNILDNELIAAINQVGILFDKQIYYLPQLIAAAEAMSHGVEILEPHLKNDKSGSSKGTVVIATVEHDIHDIGKNLVALMLKNYGYNVIDLGKDVPAEEIINTAIKEKADIIGLSALMTTTMMEMKKVVDMVKEKGADIKVMVGGAVVTQGFADEIGADGYSNDAKEAVEVADRLVADKQN